MKKVLSIILAVIMVVCTLPLSLTVSADVTSGTTGDCTWTLDDGVLTISGNGKMGDYTWETPWGDDITDVIIEDGVLNIGDYAFSNSIVSNITIADSVTYFGDDIFGMVYFHGINVWYEGSESDKDNINLGKYNFGFEDATWHFNICNIDEHSFTAACDADCNICGWIRPTKADCVYEIEIIEKEATCGEDGYGYYECAFCHGREEGYFVINASGLHTINYPCDDYCVVCGSPNDYALDHVYSEYITFDNYFHYFMCGVCSQQKHGYHRFDDEYDVECDCGAVRPEMPKVANKTHNSITLVATDGYEYSCDWGENWQKSNVFTDLEPNTEYYFSQRVAATEISSAGIESGYILVVINEIGEVSVTFGDPNGNGKIDATDALTILHAVVGKVQFTDDQNTIGDVDGDGKLSATDALLILHFVVGKINKFPVEG